MSDFDKEAERERLREKYEREQADREATQRMSDLLLKGARMTNTHCETCGDPYFQHEGVTFCPTCHGGPEGVEATLEEGAEEASEATGASANPTDADAADAGAGEGAESRGAEGEIDVATPEAGDQSAAAEREGIHQREADATAERPSAAANRSQSQPTPAQPARERRPPQEATPPATTGDATGDLEAARQSLRASLEGFAAEAARTEDPRYAKECLEAAREAAEALAALR